MVDDLLILNLNHRHEILSNKNPPATNEGLKAQYYPPADEINRTAFSFSGFTNTVVSNRRHSQH